MTYLRNIQRLSGRTNMGGITPSIKVARRDDIASIPEPVNGIVYGDVVFKAGQSWLTWAVILATGSTSSESKTSQEGSSKSNRVPFSVSRYDSGVHEMFNRCLDDAFVILVTDTNGRVKIFGSLQRPVRFAFVHNSGTDFANRNQFNCEFYYDGPENMHGYNGAIAAPPAGSAPAVVRFNGVVIASLQPGDIFDIESDYSLTDYFVTT